MPKNENIIYNETFALEQKSLWLSLHLELKLSWIISMLI